MGKGSGNCQVVATVEWSAAKGPFLSFLTSYSNNTNPISEKIILPLFANFSFCPSLCSRLLETAS